MTPARPFITPWVRGWLAAHPEEAMAVEALRLTLPADAKLSMFAQSDRGPFGITLYFPGGARDGYRGFGRTVLAAMQSAVSQHAAEVAS